MFLLYEVKVLKHGGQINHSVSYLAPMLPIDVTFNIGDETERAWTHRTRLKIRGTSSRKEESFVYRATSYRRCDFDF